jgi:hypothetical protein
MTNNPANPKAETGKAKAEAEAEAEKVEMEKNVKDFSDKKVVPGKKENNIFDFEAQSLKALNTIVIFIIVGFFCSIFYSFQAASTLKIITIIVTTLLVAGAALLGGGLLGFLFGIPKKLQQNTTTNDAYQENTNLEQISDWLTKIIVGLGLTQLAKIPAALQNYSDFTAPGLGNFDHGNVFAIALLLYFLICGFLLTYFWTRLYLAGALTIADRAAQKDINKQSEADMKAFGIVSDQLYPPDPQNPITEAQLNDAIKNASDKMREVIYVQSNKFIQDHWVIADMLKRIIPIFQALIPYDKESNYSHSAYLGHALKEQGQDDWSEALINLNKAIINRPWPNYDVWIELDRAEGSIKNDENFKKDQASTDSKDKILNDLKVAAKDPEQRDNISMNPRIINWIKLNPNDFINVVPKLIDLTEQEARDNLINAKIALGEKITQPNSDKVGRVVQQDPPEGTIIMGDSTVKITVGSQ